MSIEKLGGIQMHQEDLLPIRNNFPLSLVDLTVVVRLLSLASSSNLPNFINYISRFRENKKYCLKKQFITNSIVPAVFFIQLRLHHHFLMPFSYP